MRWARPPWTWLAIVWAIACAGWLHFQVATPGADVFQFKGPGVYFVQHGLLGGINMPFSPPNVPLVYAFYPPLYPLLFGLWCKIAGISLQSSTLFDLLMRALRSVMIIATVWPVMRATMGATRKAENAGAWLVGVTVLLLAFGPNNEDRPDELSIALALGSWLALRGGRLTLTGILLGLCGATSPAGGFFAALGAVLICRTRPKPVKSIATLALISMVVMGAAIAPMIASDHTVIDRFVKGVRFNAAPYGYALESRPLAERFAQVVHERYKYFQHGFSVAMLLVSLVLLCVWSWRRSDQAARAWAAPIAAASVIFGVTAFLIFPKDPLYLWFATVGLLIVVLGLAQSHQRFAFVQTAIVLGLAVMLARESKQVLDGLTRPSDQTVEAAQARLLPQIPSSARVSVWPDAYFTLAGARAVESLEFACPVIGTYDYVFVSTGTGFPAAPISAPSLSLWCGVPAAACFTIQDDFRNSPPVPVVGELLDMRTRGFGGILYKRTGC